MSNKALTSDTIRHFLRRVFRVCLNSPNQELIPLHLLIKNTELGRLKLSCYYQANDVFQRRALEVYSIVEAKSFSPNKY